MRNQRAAVTGTVLSAKMDKTVVVRVERTERHPTYDKVVKRSKKYYAHDESGAKEGDLVRIVQTRPLSKLKRWRVEKILTGAVA